MLGASGRRILKALIAGESDAGALAALGGPRLKCSRQELKDALEGRITSHHRFLVGQHLRMIEELEATVTASDARIEAVLAPSAGCQPVAFIIAAIVAPVRDCSMAMTRDCFEPASIPAADRSVW